MPKIYRFLNITTFLFLFSTFANAQAVASYLFLEVVDSNQKPIAEAKIEKFTQYQPQLGNQTDEKGILRLMYMFRIPNLSELKISKSDYYPFQLFGLMQDAFFEGGALRFRENFKIELLKIPRNKDEKLLLGNEQLKRDFFLAVLNGDSAEVRRMLKSGINPNITTDDLRGVPAPKDVPAMLYATDNLDLAVIDEFLNAKVDLRRKNSNIRNILAYFLGSSNQIKTKENISYQEKQRIFNKYAETLIEAGADPNSTNTFGETSLTLAAKHNNLELVKKLIERGADINAKNKTGSTTLLEMFKLHSTPQDDAWKMEIINFLLKSGANPNIIHDNQYECNSPLMSAVLAGRIDLVKLLLSYKAEANLKCKNGVNALSRLFGRYNPNYAGLLDTLIEAGTDVKTANEQGYTPLMIAVDSGNIPIIKKLLSKGASVNAQNAAGVTALMISLNKKFFDSGESSQPNIEIVELLLKSGANPNLTVNSNGGTNYGTALAEAIWFQPSYSSQEIQYASNDIIKLLIDYKADVNLTVQYKDSPLVSAVKGGRIEALKILIEAGANVKGEEGRKALAIARVNMKYDKDKSTLEQIVKLLEAAGAK